MKIRFILASMVLLLITIRSLYCQKECCCISANRVNYGRELTGELFEKTLDTVTWFNKEWLSCDIFLSDGEVIRNKQIKYNGFFDELFWKEQESGKTIKLDKAEISRFHFLNLNGDTSVYFRKLPVKRNILTDSTEVFVQEVYKGILSLFVFHNIYVERREIIAKNNVYFEQDIYLEKPIYILRNSNNTIAIKSLNRKNLSSLFPYKKAQIRKFFKQARKVRIEIYPHMIMLMKFLNSIEDQ